MSPILFKLYLHDLAGDLDFRKEIEVFKFADDGTMRVTGSTTEECLQNLKIVCDSLHKWSTTWRMIINCNPSKTELICFGTAEKNFELIPQTFNIGNNIVSFVKKTRVLGLVMDHKLSYIDHGKEINRKILGRWVTICKHTNRNWGFKQHVIVRLLEVIVATCIQYAGIIWINNRSIGEVEQTWYRILKSATGAVFNISLSLAEAILGVLPLSISNKVNSIKHLLKLNIFSDANDRDPLKGFIGNHLQSNNYSHLISRVKDTFEFLEWKAKMEPGSFTANDLKIINTNYLEKFLELSSDACCYTKLQIKKYAELKWQTSIKSKFQIEGYSDAPKVNTMKLRFPSKTPRNLETLMISLFYPNNLLNEFLHRQNKSKYGSPLCCCGHGEQNSKHILLYCRNITASKRQEMSQLLSQYPLHSLDTHENNAFLISWTRMPKFFRLCLEIASEAMEFLRTEIVL